MIYFIVNKNNKVLHPTKRKDYISKLLKRGQAKIIKRYSKEVLLVKIFKNLKSSKTVDCEFRIGIDPGYKFIGFSMYKIYQNIITKLFSGVLETRTSGIKDLLTERRMYRNIRRQHRRQRVLRKYSKAKFRHPRWKNRRDKLDFNPTLRHLYDSHMNLLTKLFKLVNIEESKIHIEYGKFDIQKINNPSIFGYQYQQGLQFGYENVKLYVKSRDRYICTQCKSKDLLSLQVHHIKERSNGGTDKPDNLITVCKDCHSKIHSGLIKLKLNSKTNRDTSVLNSVMKHIYETISNYVITQDTYGYIVNGIRKLYNLEKDHAVDASIIAFCDSDNIQDLNDYTWKDLNHSISFKQFRRHQRNFVKRYEDRKYYNVNNKIVAWNRGKRIGQSKPSLIDYKKTNPDSQVWLKTPGRIIYRKPNSSRLVVPGDKIIYDKKWYTCLGNASTQGKIGLLETNNYYPKRYCKKVLNNSGMVSVNH